MQNQKFKWHESAKELPNNKQTDLLVSYTIPSSWGSHEIRCVYIIIGFRPEDNIVNEKLVICEHVCDYWSPIPNLPKGAYLRMINDEPAIIPEQTFE